MKNPARLRLIFRIETTDEGEPMRSAVLYEEPPRDGWATPAEWAGNSNYAPAWNSFHPSIRFDPAPRCGATKVGAGVDLEFRERAWKMAAEWASANGYEWSV